ncbi:MAG: HAD family hydrolase [Lachnospiraceae bacterium]|nr:HAD family hydrolase [Lachnospiraceae bacterium]
MDIILDIDGTLWDTTGVVAKAWNRALKEGGPAELDHLCITAAMLKKEFGKPMDVIADDLFGDIPQETKDHLMELCCQFEHEEISACVEDLTYPHMRETLKALSETHDLYIVSNCQDGYIELVLEKNHIGSLIKDFECFGRTGLQKDENISLLIRRNGLKNPVYVGDTTGDMEAAKKAGVPFIFARYGFGDVKEYKAAIDSFEDLLKMFQ